MRGLPGVLLASVASGVAGSFPTGVCGWGILLCSAFIVGVQIKLRVLFFCYKHSYLLNHLSSPSPGPSSSCSVYSRTCYPYCLHTTPHFPFTGISVNSFIRRPSLLIFHIQKQVSLCAQQPMVISAETPHTPRPLLHSQSSTSPACNPLSFGS